MFPYHPNEMIFGIPSYAIIFWISWLLGYIVLRKEVKRKNLDQEKMTNIFLLSIFISPIFGRAMFFLGPWRPAANTPMQMFDMTVDGYNYYGFLVGIFIAIIIGSKIFKQDIWKMLDIFSLAGALSMFVGRIGCFLAGCCFGEKTTSWFSLDIVGRDYSRWPTTIMDSFYNLLIFIVLSWQKQKQRFDGQISLLFLIMYASCRFVIEFFRYHSWHLLGLTINQFVSLLILPIAILIYMRKSSNKPERQ